MHATDQQRRDDFANGLFRWRFSEYRFGIVPEPSALYLPPATGDFVPTNEDALDNWSRFYMTQHGAPPWYIGLCLRWSLVMPLRYMVDKELGNRT